MAIMNQYEQEVIVNIIYAVETGGQIYGNRRYNDFTPAGKNTTNEVAITIGAGQWYATEAQKLLKLIRSTDPANFKKLDTAGIGVDLDTKSWSTYKVAVGSAKAKCIQSIIDSSVGRKCQDQLIVEQMEKFMKEAQDLGVVNMDALMMCANFRHHGGLKAVKRILGKTSKPYTLDKLYAACSTDTGNQVGAYKSRQKVVVAALKKYISPGEYLKDTTEVWKATGTKLCIDKTANVYKAADGKVTIGQISKGNRIEINGAKSGKYTNVKVGNNIGIGWILTSQLGDKVTEDTKPTVDNNGVVAIKTAQRKLNSLYYLNILVDGIWGDQSQKALITAIQIALNKQFNEGLVVDGVNGPKTTAAIRRRVLTGGMKGEYVKVLQIALQSKGIEVSGGIDGIYGQGTTEAVKKFQKDVKIEVDGSAGPITFTHLIK
ncbi:MAG: peptidoglycan-binding domain-containing protein [Candidatus Izemoplasmatales bacterium]|nr:peptidoglycan-binding domain-containing protein [Candidatus Izemoplasmatales bacterium]